MIGPAAVRRVAGVTEFREEAVEKVLYLTAILGRLRTHPSLQNAWVLKGGTAINLFHLDVPRLSVAIDLNFIGEADLKAMQAARPEFERTVEASLLTEDPVLRDRIAAQPMLRWKVMRVRRFHGLPPLEPEEV